MGNSLTMGAGMETRTIYCCACVKKVDARLTDGVEIYPHRPDLHSLPFWKCDTCGNYVGCHHKTSNPTHPLGNIPSPEIKKARMHIHAILDPLWKSKKYKRTKLYTMIAEGCGLKTYHTAQIRTIEEARSVYKFILGIIKNSTPKESSYTPSSCIGITKPKDKKSFAAICNTNDGLLPWGA
jgi:hypothetical protein